MRHDSQRTALMMVTALVLALAAMLAGPAGARPIDDEGTELTSSQRASVRPDDRGGLQGVGSIAEPQLVVPYLSHGVGVDEANLAGTPATAEPQTVVPYLSRGVGVDESQFSGTQNPNTDRGGLERSDLPATTAPQSDDGFGWRDTSTFGAAMAALLLAALALLAIRGRHGGKVAT